MDNNFRCKCTHARLLQNCLQRIPVRLRAVSLASASVPNALHFERVLVAVWYSSLHLALGRLARCIAPAAGHVERRGRKSNQKTKRLEKHNCRSCARTGGNPSGFGKRFAVARDDLGVILACLMPCRDCHTFDLKDAGSCHRRLPLCARARMKAEIPRNRGNDAGG